MIVLNIHLDVRKNSKHNPLLFSLQLLIRLFNNERRLAEITHYVAASDTFKNNFTLLIDLLTGLKNALESKTKIPILKRKELLQTCTEK